MIHVVSRYRERATVFIDSWKLQVQPRRPFDQVGRRAAKGSITRLGNWRERSADMKENLLVERGLWRCRHGRPKKSEAIDRKE